MVIMPYADRYKDDVIDLILDIQQKEFGVAITREDQPDLQAVASFYQQGCGNFWVAIHDEEVVGTISLKDIGNNQGALRKMFVKQSYRGTAHRTAQLLLEELLKWSCLHEVSDIFLGTTAQFLAAHRFYEKHGFNEISQDKLPEAFPLMKVDTRFYHLAL